MLRKIARVISMIGSMMLIGFGIMIAIQFPNPTALTTATILTIVGISTLIAL